VFSWVFDLIKLATTSLASEDHELWNVHMKAWCEQANNEEAIHHNIQCNGCQAVPIRGIRYKCSTCRDYDLCEKCEASGQHCRGHPLLKIVRPMCPRNFGMDHFAGLQEVIGRRHCRRASAHHGFGHGHQGFGHGHQGFGHGRNHPCWMKFMCKEKEKSKYCTREDKQKEKLQCKKNKLMEKLNKINSKLDPNENAPLKCSLEIPCVCGALLVQMSPMTAYNCSRVTCDRCQMDCSREAVIFHCPANRAQEHPHGYDVCLKCASKDGKMSECSSPKKEEEPSKKEEEEIPEIMEPIPIIEEEIAPVVEPEVVEPEVVAPVETEVIRDPFEEFQYAAEARCLVEMGFLNHEQIMTLLVAKNGNLEQVIADLFSQ